MRDKATLVIALVGILYGGLADELDVLILACTLWITVYVELRTKSVRAASGEDT